MNKIVKKLVTSILAVSMVVSLMTGSVSASTIAAASGERVKVIVQTKGASVLSAEGIAEMGIDVYRKTSEAKKREKKALSVQSRVQNEIEQTAADAEFGFSYTNVFNGFSVEINASDISKVRALDGVKAVYQVQTHSVEEPLTADTATSTDVESCCEMMGVDTMHENGYTGEGQVVAVVDTELDVNHEMFSGTISNAKYTKNDIKEIIKEKGINANASANQVYRSEKIPYAYNYSYENADVYSSDEDVWHGTHVAGIAVGNAGKTPDGKTFTGVAPDAQLCFFGVPDLSDDTLLAALDDAARMDVDVVNCSWGSSYQGTNDIYEEAMGNLKNAGIAVYAAAGNDGDENEYLDVLTTDVDDSSGGQPQALDSVLSVASADITSSWSIHYKLTADGQTIEYTLQGNKNFARVFSDQTYEYVSCGYGEEQDFENLDLEGKIALIRVANRDGVELECSEKADFAIQAGAVGIILINDQESLKQQIRGMSELPTILVQKSDGELLEKASKKSFTTENKQYGTQQTYSNGTISSYSSWGTDSSLELKPDITAVGGNIYSSVADDDYELMSGTSMAAPHMAGSWALLKPLLEEKYSDAENIIELGNYLLMSSATIVYQDDEKKIPYSPRQQGAGLTNLEAAAETPVYLEGTGGKCSISLKDQLGDTFELKFTAKNLSDEDVTYDSVSMYVMTDDYEEEDDQYKKADQMKSLSYTCDLPESVTVPARGEKEIALTVKLNSKETAENMKIFSNGFFVDGYVVLDSKEASQPQISIPYTGFYGDWTSTQILDGKYYGGESRLLGNCLLSGGDDGYYILGTNGYTKDTDDESEDYESEDYVGFSPNGDGQFDEFIVHMNYLRDVKSVTCDIKNKSGETISHVSLEGKATRKYADTFYMEVESNPLIEDGKMPTEEGDYTATVSATLAYEREKTEAVTMKFYIDTTAPELGEVQIVQEAGKTYLKVQATDNKYLSGVEVYDTATAGEDYYADAAFKPGQKGSAKVDVTGQDLSELSLELCDYAGNVTGENVQELVQGGDETPSASSTPAPSATTKPTGTTTVKKPGQVKIKSAKNKKKKSVTVKLSKTKNAKKYQIYYATNKKFKKAKKATTKKLSCVLKKLKKGKTYYIKVRAINGNRKGKWSKIKRVKVKK